MSPARRYKQDSFGSLFKRLRKDAGFSLKKLSERTKIQEKYLEHLEGEDFGQLPPDVYVRGFIAKCAALFDQEDAALLFRLYTQHARAVGSPASTRKGVSIRGLGGNGMRASFFLTPRRVALLGALLFLAILIGYLSVRFVPFLFTPTITLAYPSGENLVVNFSEITVEGTTKYAASLTLNGEELYIGKNGLFMDDFVLEEGVNILTIRARSRFGRRVEVVRRVVYIKNTN